jgi:hypothetical protein
VKPFYRLIFTLGVAEFARGLIFLGVLPWLGTAAAVGAMSLNVLGETFAKPMGGWVIDHYGWRVTLRLALPLLAGGIMLTALPSMILVGAVVAGLASGWVHLCVLRSARNEELGWVQSSWMAGVGAGVLGAPWVAGYGLTYLCLFVTGLIVVAMVACLRVEGGRRPEARSRTGGFGTAWRVALRLLPLVFLQTAVAAGLIAALPILGRLFWGAGHYNIILLTGGISCVPFLLARRFHNRRGRIVGATVIALGLALLAANLNLYLELLGMACIGAGLGLFMPAWLHVVKARAPESAAGRLWALIGLIEGLSASVGTALSEWLMPKHAPGLLASGALAYAALAVIHTFIGGTEGSPDSVAMSHQSSALPR